MYEGMLGLHSLLRWIILIFLIINIIRVNVEAQNPFTDADRKWSLRLLIATHLTLLIGLYQYFFGEKGFALIKEFGMKDVMRYPGLRFWVVEHITAMLLAVAVITISHIYGKKEHISSLKRHRVMGVLYILAFVIILAGVPWPFRDVEIARPWFRGLYN